MFLVGIRVGHFQIQIGDWEKIDKMENERNERLVELILHRLARHVGEVDTAHTEESPLEAFDRILLDHEKFHHGADVEPVGR